MTTISAHRAPRSATLTGYYGFIILGINSVLIASVIRSVEHDFGQSDAALGFLYLLSSLCYTAGAFSGVLAERVGRRILLVGAAILLVIGLGGQGLAPTWPLLLLATAGVGVGGGVIDAGTNGLFLDLYRHARGGALNFLHLFFGIGALIGPFAVGHALTAGASWHAILLVVAAAWLPLIALLATVPMPSGRRGETMPTEGEATATGRNMVDDTERSERSLIPFYGLAIGIGFYVAAEVGVSNWIVRFLSGVPVATATDVLSLFWGGLALGRLLSNLLVEKLDYHRFTVGCIVLASLSLLAAVLSPVFPLAAACFALTGLFCGPIYPMIMALGGNIYPHRLAALSSGLAGAAVAGSVIYPPLMGILAGEIGLRGGMIGAALLGIPMIVGLTIARAGSRWKGGNDNNVAAAAR